MNIKIYVLSEKFEKFYLEGIKEYDKRLSRYCKLTLQLFKNEDALLKKITDRTYKILLSTDGLLISSEDLASKIDTLGISGSSDVTFIIGCKNVLIEENLAISKMEMDLGLNTTILLEQIYRAYRILNNQPYHK